MATRGDLIAATAALLLVAPVAAMAQAVPPPRSQTEAKLPSETLGNHASKVGFATGVVEAGADLNNAMLGAQKTLQSTYGLNHLAPAEDLTDALRTGEKVAGGAKVVGAFAGAVALAADSAAAYEKCTNPQYNKAECAVASLDVVADVAGLVPGPAATLSTTYAVSKAGAEYLDLNSLAPNASANFYDWWHSDEQSEAFAKTSTPEALESLRRTRRAAYIQAQGGLISKQADYDAQQARLEAERQAATQQAASAFQTQNLLHNLNAALRPQLSPSPAPASQGIDVCAQFGGCNFSSPFLPQRSAGAASPPGTVSQPRPTTPAKPTGCDPAVTKGCVGVGN